MATALNKATKIERQ